ncbi:MAG: NADH-quinone oxidoreductase subunit NuoK [Syntrophorhabdaceae bacterium]|nr:NADH-quinone oxidoreductase subunit NuoK [Syntrophorhabdaceae bacterium]MDD4195354.1 NADH-quinone oxidoreductase subunit NuoK [Syntrophorhabdaceae bacterium]
MNDAEALNYGMALAGLIFAIGLTGVLMRRNLIFILLSMEIMLNATGFAFIVAGAKWASADGQVMFILILAVAAAEVAIGLALLLRFHGMHKTLDTGRAAQMKG